MKHKVRILQVFIICAVLTLVANCSNSAQKLSKRPVTRISTFNGLPLSERIVIIIKNKGLPSNYVFDNKGQLVDLRRANFKKCNLSHSNLSNMDLGAADLSETDLTNCKIHGSFLGSAKLTKARITGSSLLRSNFTGANLTHADLRKSQIQHSIFDEAKLLHTDLTNAKILKTTFICTNLKGAILSKVLLSECSLLGACMKDVNYGNKKDCIFEGLEGENTGVFTFNSLDKESKLRFIEKNHLAPFAVMKTSVVRANLAGMDLSKRDFRLVSFKYADFTNADLSETDLSGACLEKALLVRTNLNKTDFKNTKVSDVDIGSAINIEKAKNLKCTKPPYNWLGR